MKNELLKNKILLFIVIFSIANIFTFPAFTVTHNLDSYCTVYNGYNETALWFAQNGRIITAFFYYFFNIISLPLDSLGFVSAFFANVFLTLAIMQIYKVVNTNLKLENCFWKALLLISSFLLFYNPLTIELYMVDETFVICLGIFLITLGAKYINQRGIKNYLLALLFIILGVICYQGIASYLFLLTILFAMTNINNNDKQDVKVLWQKIGLSILCYIIAFAIMYGILQLVLVLTGSVTSKLGNIDLIANIQYTFNTLMPDALTNLFGFGNKKIYYGFCLLILALVILGIIKNDGKKINIMLTFLIVLAALIAPFLPNFVMSTDSNYSAARMTLTLMSIPSALMILIICRLKVDFKYYVYGLLLIMIILFALFARTFIANTKIDLKRYKADTSYLNQIYAVLNYYEIENDTEIKTVYWAKDTDVAYYYSFGYANGSNIRVVAVDWAMECAFNVYTNNKYEYKAMSEDDYEKYFKDKNYDEFDENSIVIEDDVAYVLLY